MRVTNDTVLCNLCLEDVDEESLQATHYCNNCNKNLCESHVHLHKAKKSTKDHNLNPLITSNQQSPTATTIPTTTSVTSTATVLSSIVINQQHYCKYHPDQLLEIYCEECDDGNKRLQSLQNEKQLLNNCNNDINNLRQINNENAIDSLQNKKRKIAKEINNLNKLNVLNNLNEMNEFKFNDDNLINLINTKLGNIENKEINNNQLLFNDNTLQENTLQNNNITKKNFTDIVFIVNNNEEDYSYNDDSENIQLIQFLKLKMKISINNFNLIKFELISKFGGPNNGNGNDKLNYPNDIIYKNNLIYISDYGNNRIIILDNLLNYKNEIKLNSEPLSLAINSNNYLFIGCHNNIIYKYNLNTLQLMNEIKSNENYTFNYIYGMTCDDENNLYICNNNKEIIILNENNEFIRKFKINLKPQRILINNKNQIVITCSDGEIQVYNKLGNFISNVKFNNSNLNGIINDKNDNYIICDWYNNKLLLLDNEFKLKKEFNENYLNKPIGITLNEENNQIYIVDNWGHCCKLFK